MQLAQAFDFVVDGNDQREHQMASSVGEGLRGAKKYRIVETSTSDTSETSRITTAETIAAISPKVGTSSAVTTNSRTPSPPGISDMNPATVAKAMLAVSIGSDDPKLSGASVTFAMPRKVAQRLSP